MIRLASFLAGGIAAATVAMTPCMPVYATNINADDTATAVSNKNTSKLANRQLANAVRSRLFKQRGLSASGVFVFARNGAIVLVGSVPDQSQISRAQKVAEETSGVYSVKNSLTVREQGR